MLGQLLYVDPVNSTSVTHIKPEHNPIPIYIKIGSQLVVTISRSVLAVKSKFNADRDPTPNDDTSQGFSTGSMWINKESNRVFICMGATVGLARWFDTTPTEVISGVDTITVSKTFPLRPASTEFIIPHGMKTNSFTFQVFDDLTHAMLPAEVIASDVNTIRIIFGEPVIGKVVVHFCIEDTNG